MDLLGGSAALPSPSYWSGTLPGEWSETLPLSHGSIPEHAKVEDGMVRNTAKMGRNAATMVWNAATLVWNTAI